MPPRAGAAQLRQFARVDHAVAIAVQNVEPSSGSGHEFLCANDMVQICVGSRHWLGRGQITEATGTRGVEHISPIGTIRAASGALPGAAA